jgi:ribonuclease inhibitor
MQYNIKLTSIKNEIDLHKILKDAFNFPDYYGCNWDAFIDCMRDLLEIEKVNLNIKINNNTDFFQLKDCLEILSKESENLIFNIKLTK